MPAKIPITSSIGKKRRINKLNAYLLTNTGAFTGRRRDEAIDLEEIKRLVGIGCTEKEIAGVLRVSVSWIQREKEKNPAVAMAFVEGDSALKQSLRHAQVQMALNGSAAMLIWLGKQYLYQVDKHEQKNTTEISITVQRATEELRNIPRGQLLQALEVMNMPVIDQPSESAEPAADEPPHPPSVD